MDEFMHAMTDVFPNLLVQFEDFSTDNAFRYLDRYRYRYRVFNDDVRCTLFCCSPLLIAIHRFKVQDPSSCLASPMLHVSRRLPRVDRCQTTSCCSLVRVLRELALQSSYFRFSLSWA
jgi:hypothetical protein